MPTIIFEDGIFETNNEQLAKALEGANPQPTPNTMTDNKQVSSLDEAAEKIYRRMNSYANPSEMRGILKEWIIATIKQGLTEWQSQQTKPLRELISKEIFKHLNNQPYEGGYPGDWQETLAEHLSKFFSQQKETKPTGLKWSDKDMQNCWDDAYRNMAAFDNKYPYHQSFFDYLQTLTEETKPVEDKAELIKTYEEYISLFSKCIDEAAFVFGYIVKKIDVEQGVLLRNKIQFLKNQTQKPVEDKETQLEPIQNALYATGKFTTDECKELAEGILIYINEPQTPKPVSEEGWKSVEDIHLYERLGWSNSVDVNISYTNGEVSTGSYSFLLKKWYDYIFQEKPDWTLINFKFLPKPPITNKL